MGGEREKKGIVRGGGRERDVSGWRTGSREKGLLHIMGVAGLGARVIRIYALTTIYINVRHEKKDPGKSVGEKVEKRVAMFSSLGDSERGRPPSCEGLITKPFLLPSEHRSRNTNYPGRRGANIIIYILYVRVGKNLRAVCAEFNKKSIYIYKKRQQQSNGSVWVFLFIT